MKIKFLKSMFLSLPLLITSTLTFSNGLTLGATRLIYEEGAKESVVTFENDGDVGPYLVQSWVTGEHGKDESFIITPPLFKLGKNTSSVIHVVFIGNDKSLPADRESLFYLNVKAIPAVSKEDNPTRVIISTQNIIKLIYRPKALNYNGHEKAVADLAVEKSSNGLKILNNSPYILTIAKASVNGKSIDSPGNILPFSSKDVNINSANVKTFKFSTINDFGALTDPKEYKF